LEDRSSKDRLVSIDIQRDSFPEPIVAGSNDPVDESTTVVNRCQLLEPPQCDYNPVETVRRAQVLQSSESIPGAHRRQLES
jgi:hypothetical protein